MMHDIVCFQTTNVRTCSYESILMPAGVATATMVIVLVIYAFKLSREVGCTDRVSDELLAAFVVTPIDAEWFSVVPKAREPDFAKTGVADRLHPHAGQALRQYGNQQTYYGAVGSREAAPAMLPSWI